MSGWNGTAGVSRVGVSTRGCQKGPPAISASQERKYCALHSNARIYGMALVVHTQHCVCVTFIFVLFSHTLYTERCSLYHSVLSLYICSVCVTAMSVVCSVLCVHTHTDRQPTVFILIFSFEESPPLNR